MKLERQTEIKSMISPYTQFSGVTRNLRIEVYIQEVAPGTYVGFSAAF